MKMNLRLLACLCIAVACGAMLGECAQAQSSYASATLRGIRNRNSASRYSSESIQSRLSARSTARVGVPGVNRRVYSGASQPSKPFKGLNRGPTVSPYLALSGSLNGVSDYYNIVRPQQRQRSQNARVQRQLAANRRRLNQIAAAGPFDLRGDPNLAPTGHAATRMFYENFQSTGNFFAPPQGLTKQYQ